MVGQSNAHILDGFPSNVAGEIRRHQEGPQGPAASYNEAPRGCLGLA